MGCEGVTGEPVRTDTGTDAQAGARVEAFVRQPRDLTREGRTKPGHIPDLRHAGPGRIVVLVPAHNEEALIAETLESLAAQTRPPDEVIVVADRCTDQTARISTAHGAKAVETVGNTQDKAGALNQVLDRLLPQLGDDDAVMVMDSDTSLSPQFIAEAARRLRHQEPDQSPIGGVGAIFFGYPLRGLVCHLQNNEYVRYARELHRRHGRADVLTGTATLYPVHALRHVHEARAHGSLPRGRDVYDVESLTEDNELTLALKHLGYRCVSPCACIVGTELMPTWSRLYYQRLRWQRGALDNLKAYGTTRVTLPYICSTTAHLPQRGLRPLLPHRPALLHHHQGIPRVAVVLARDHLHRRLRTRLGHQTRRMEGPAAGRHDRARGPLRPVPQRDLHQSTHRPPDRRGRHLGTHPKPHPPPAARRSRQRRASPSSSPPSWAWPSPASPSASPGPSSRPSCCAVSPRPSSASAASTPSACSCLSPAANSPAAKSRPGVSEKASRRTRWPALSGRSRPARCRTRAVPWRAQNPSLADAL